MIDLDTITERHRKAVEEEWSNQIFDSLDDIPSLISEVRRLRADLATRDQVIRRAAEVGQRHRDTAILRALGFDMLSTKWRYGFNGWERQAEDAQAGCFPAVDWIDEFIGGALGVAGGDGEIHGQQG